MNRLSPLITRRTGPWTAGMSLEEPDLLDAAAPAAWAEDLKLFALGWIGGVVFFGTLLS